MKTKDELIKELKELKLESISIQKHMDKGCDYDVWKSLDVDLTECETKIEVINWILNIK